MPSRVIDGIEHVQDKDGEWVPASPAERIRKTMINAGRDLLDKVRARNKDLSGSGSAEAGETLGQKINYPGANK